MNELEHQEDRVVIRFKDSVVKGYLESPSWRTIQEVLENAPVRAPEILHVRRDGALTAEEIDVAEAKAIFYVIRFEGNPDHKDVSFANRAPFIPGVWVRLEFRDGETMEGIVYNTIHFVVGPGLFIRPSDPFSNNRLVYVSKQQLKGFRVLGLRKA